MPPRSPTTVGMAVETTVISIAAMERLSRSETTVRGRLVFIDRAWMPRERRRSALSWGERIAGVGAAALEAYAEPPRAVRGRSVRERLGGHPAAGHLLEPVVADGRGGTQTLLDVAWLEHLPLGRG